MQEKNFWATTVDSPAIVASPNLADSVDVAVVGGGYCGLPPRARSRDAA